MIKLVAGVSESILANDGLVVSDGTLNPEHLISAFLRVLEPCDEIQEILYNPMGRDKNEICTDLWDAIEKIDIGTDRYIFSIREGDGACIGWFLADEFF